MSGHLYCIVATVGAGNQSKKEKAATELMTNLASGFETILEAHERLGSVASSSQRRS